MSARSIAVLAALLSTLAGTLVKSQAGPAPAPGQGPLSGTPPVRALASAVPADAPLQAHKIAGNLYYVGTRGLAVYLVTTAAGHILINAVYPASVPLVRASVEALGFDMHDIKLMLNSHAHPDHVSGNADLKALTGASVLVMDDDVDVIRSGGRSDFQYA